MIHKKKDPYTNPPFGETSLTVIITAVMLPQRFRPGLDQRPFRRFVRVWNVLAQGEGARVVHRAARGSRIGPQGTAGTVAAAAVVAVAFQRCVHHVPVGVDGGVAQRAQLVVQRDRDRVQGHRTCKIGNSVSDGGRLLIQWRSTMAGVAIIRQIVSQAAHTTNELEKSIIR